MKCLQALDELEIENARTHAESESRIMEVKMQEAIYCMQHSPSPFNYLATPLHHIPVN